MQARALVLLLVVALVNPATPLADVASASTPWDAPYELVRRGDYAQAIQAYADLADHPDTAPRARLLQARTELLNGDTDSGEATLQALLAAYPQSDQSPGAWFTLAQVRRAAGDCAGALRALDAYVASRGSPALGPYTPLQRAQCDAKLGDWAGELAAARSALATDGGGPRLTQIEALERAAEASLKLGRQQDALDYYTRCLGLAATRAYRAEMLFTTATLAHELGQDGVALERWRAVVVDFADQPRAPGALDNLVALGQGGVVSPAQAGQARLAGKQYQAAIDQFDQVGPGSGDWGVAQLGRADALLQLGQTEQARQSLDSIATADPTHAATALLRLGQLQERAGELSVAEDTYQRMAAADAARAAEALFHVGLLRYLRSDPVGALGAWETALASQPGTSALDAQLSYWASRALPVGSADADAALNRAAAVAPESYYGLRAQAVLDGSLTVATARGSRSSDWLTPTGREIDEREAWLGNQHTSMARVAAELAGLPALQRADTLLELGLHTEASWEIQGVLQQYVANQDLAHLSGLADWLSARDLPNLTLLVGRAERDIVGAERLGTLPRAVQKQVYPAGWGDIVAEQSAQFGVDPLLLLAVIRQESSFDPRAQSGAQAMGLTQVVPATARGIAARLGRADFGLTDLFKPAVSVQFGAWFLAQALGDYGGRVFPALAAYDAGGGNVARWLDKFGDDPDVLVEEVPFSETQAYLHIVYDNYVHYVRLYG